MARVWTWGDPNNPPEPDTVVDLLLHVRTTKRNYELERGNALLEPHLWRPVTSPANEKQWDEWLENWGPLTAIE
jgi:hypothetical protein